MTGRDFIIYILENHLEDEKIFVDGRVPGFMTQSEAAVEFSVGPKTIEVWIKCNLIDHIKIGDRYYIPKNAEFRKPQ